MSNNDIFIRIKAILDKMTEAEFNKELDRIQKKLKPLKIKTITNVKGSQFINLDVERQAFNEISSRIRQIRKNIDELAKVDILTNKKGQITSAVLTYYNKELGQTVTETMGWSEALKKVNGELVKFKTFETLGFKYTDNMAKARREAEKLKATQEAITRRDFNYGQLISGVDASTFTSRDSFVDYIKKQYGETAELIGTFNNKQLKSGEIITQTTFRVKEGADKWRIYQATLNKTTGEMRLLDKGLRDVINRQLSLSKMLSTAASKMLIWVGVGDLIFGTFRNIQAGLETLKELDTLMVDIAKVTDLSTESMKKLKDESFALASQYGRTAQDFLKGVAEFSRAGYDEAAKGLAELSLLAQNVGELTADQANEFLLATDAAYQYAGSQEALARVLDGVNQIDNEFATSIQKISEGMTVAGSIAANAGVGVDELAAAIGTITAVTQRSGNEAGRAFRSILMNIRQIKGETEDGEIIDDEALSKSAKALANVGIKIHELRNGVEELRNPMDVLKELADKWDSLSTMEQAPIIESLAGKYRGNQLVALLENFDMYQDMLTEYMNSADSALRENEKRMDSWQAKANRFSNAVAQMWNNEINTNFVKWIIDLGTSIVRLVDNVGLLTTAIIALNVALAAFGKMGTINTAINTFANSLTSLRLSAVSTTAVINGLKVALSTLWPLLAVGAIVGLSKAFDYLNVTIEEYSESVNNSYSETQQNIESIKRLKTEYESLTKETNLSREQKLRLIEIERELKTKYGETAKAIDLQNKSLQENSKIINEIEREQARRFQILNERAYQEAQKTLNNKYVVNFGSASLEFKNIKEAIDHFEKIATDSINSSNLVHNIHLQILQKLYKEYDSAKDIVDKYNATINSTTDSINNNTDALEKNSKAQKHVVSEQLLNVQNTLLDSYKDTSAAVADLNNALHTLKEEKSLTADEINNLIDQYPELLDYISIENGQVQITAEAIEKVRQIKIKSFKDTLEAQKLEVENQAKALASKLSMFQKEIEGIETVAEAYRVAAQIAENLTGGYSDAGIRNRMMEQVLPDLSAIGEAKERIKLLQGLADTTFKTVGIPRDKSSKNTYIDRIFSPLPYYNEQVTDLLSKTDKFKDEISAIDNQLKLAESREETAKIIELQNKLIQKRKEERELLHQTANKLREIQTNIKNSIQKKFGINIEKATEVEIKSFLNDIDRRIIAQQNIAGRATSDAIKVAAQKEEDRLQRQKQLLEALVESYKNTSQKLVDVGKGWWDALFAEQDLIKANKDILDNLADKVIDVYKEIYEKQKDIALKAIDAEIDALEKAHKKKIDQLDEELEKYEEIINARLKALERTSEEEDYEKELTKLQKERQEIVNQINILSLDDSLEARARVSELNAELAEKDEQIEELKTNRSRELRRQNLEDQLEAKRKEIELEKENAKYVVEINGEKYRGVYEEAREWLEKQRDSITKYWDSIINDERYFTSIREDVLSGHMGNIEQRFAEFTNFIERNSNKIGKSISNNLLDKLREIEDELDKVSSSKSVTYRGGDGHLYTINPDGSVIHKNPATGNVEYIENNPELVEALKKKGTIVRHSGGFADSVPSNNILKLVDNLFNTKPNEVVVKALKDELFIPSKHIINNFIPNLRNLVNSFVPRPIALSSSGSPVYNVNIHIDKITGNKQGADILIKEFINGLKKRGGKL